MSDNKKMFRAEALEQLNSPEQLEQLMRVTDRRGWLTLSTVAAIIVALLSWSFWGQIPISVDGQGIITFPRQIAGIQSPAQGQISQINTAIGQSVVKGDVIAVISQPALLAQLEAQRQTLQELLARNTAVDSLSGRRSQLEREASTRQRDLLETRIKSDTEAAKTQLENTTNFIESQLANVNNVISTQTQLGKNLKERYETFSQLLKEGLSSNDTVLSAKQQMIDNQVKISELRLKIQEIELSRAKAEDTFQSQMRSVAEMRSQLQELSIRENESSQRQLESSSDRELRIQETQNQIDRLEKKLVNEGQIKSPSDGKILELSISKGQIVSLSRRLGSIEVLTTDENMQAIAYFNVGDGKKIRPGMDIKISPSTVERERYGSMEGVVVDVASFASTTEAVASTVGSQEIAKELTQNSSKIQVTSELLLDRTSTSGFKWTSGAGPDDAVTAGTTATIRATIEYRRPISFAIPLLRKWTGA